MLIYLIDAQHRMKRYRMDGSYNAAEALQKTGVTNCLLLSPYFHTYIEPHGSIGALCSDWLDKVFVNIILQ